MIEIFLAKLQEIANKFDFKLVRSKERYPSFKKKAGDRILTIGAGDLFERKIYSIGCHIIFIPIEVHFQGIDKNWEADWNPTIKQYNHTSLLTYEFGTNIYNKLPLDLTSIEAIENASNLVEEFIVSEALPFLDYWEDIRTLLPWLELEHNDYMGMNKVFGNNAILKKCIVWYHTMHPEYNTFADHHKSRLKAIFDEQPKNKVLEKGLKQLMEVRKSLEKIRPLYNWDEKYLNVKPYKPHEA